MGGDKIIGVVNVTPRGRRLLTGITGGGKLHAVEALPGEFEPDVLRWRAKALCGRWTSVTNRDWNEGSIHSCEQCRRRRS